MIGDDLHVPNGQRAGYMSSFGSLALDLDHQIGSTVHLEWKVQAAVLVATY